MMEPTRAFFKMVGNSLTIEQGNQSIVLDPFWQQMLIMMLLGKKPPPARSATSAKKIKVLRHNAEEFDENIVLGVNITRRCNLKCQYCNRLLDVMDFHDSDVSPEQFQKALKLCASDGIYIRKLKINGGEPTLHRDLIRLCEIASNQKNIKRISVSTNGTTNALILPRGCRYRTSSPTGPEKQNHIPFLISPTDIGVPESSMFDPCGPCSFMSACGRCFDREGFTFCLIAGGIGRIIGKNVYSSRPVLSRDMDVCQHCVYDIKKDRTEFNRKLIDAVKNGSLQYPSKTFAKGIARWQSGETSPYPLPPWGG